MHDGGISPETAPLNSAAETARADVASDDPEFDNELKALARLREAHSRHLAEARSLAEGLSDEAVEAAEEGIRDLVDEDAEVDAAVRAALVRQTSARAMHAVARVRDLEAQGKALAFGHTTSEDGERRYVGRISVIEGDDALLIDWRARAAIPFYRATPLDRLGVTRRRQLLYGPNADDGVPESYSDEVFDPDELGDGHHLRGEAALLASVIAPTREQMRSVVATIQAEQDAVIRAPINGPLVVQGGPGTGKTVVALHRAAYLLYDQRTDLSESGVLIVGPTSQFLNYIAGVLPSLGETGVISVTPRALFPGVRLGRRDTPEAAEIKGRIDMATLLANAVADRQRRPHDDLTVFYGSRRVELKLEVIAEFFDQAGQRATHNDGANAFRRMVIDALVEAVYDPSFSNRSEARESFSESPMVQEFLLRHWPPLSPEQALNDLLGSRALLTLASRGTQLTPDDRTSLHTERASQRGLGRRRWSDADIPLLDELLGLVGGVMGQTESDRIRERDAADEFELALQSDDSDEDAVLIEDLVEDDESEGMSLDEFLERFEGDSE